MNLKKWASKKINFGWEYSIYRLFNEYDRYGDIGGFVIELVDYYVFNGYNVLMFENPNSKGQMMIKGIKKS
jgi:hypothetical protein